MKELKDFIIDDIKEKEESAFKIYYAVRELEGVEAQIFLGEKKLLSLARKIAYVTVMDVNAVVYEMYADLMKGKTWEEVYNDFEGRFL